MQGQEARDAGTVLGLQSGAGGPRALVLCGHTSYELTSAVSAGWGL